MSSTIKRAATTLALALSAALSATPAHADILDTLAGKVAVEWWKWALQTPASVNAVTDTTGAHCAQGQSGPVWFLAGTFGNTPVTRSCDIPKGKALFFPLVNSFYGAFLNDAPETRTEAAVRAQAACTLPVTISLTVDGKSIPGTKEFFTGTPGSLSPLFDIQLPKDNVYGVDEATVPKLQLTPSSEQGYYFALPPLPAGEHTVHWTATGCKPDVSQDITYKLKVASKPSH